MVPATDQKIAQRYTAKSLEKKGKNKLALQEELGWPTEGKRPVLCLPAGMSDQLGGKLLIELLPGLLSLPVEMLVLGKGSSAYGELFTEIANEHDHRIAIIPNDEVSMRKMLAAADMALFLTNPEEMTELEQCLAYGVVPVTPVSSATKDYNPIQESGNSFQFQKDTVWHVFAAIVRALETNKFPFDWRTIQRQCMESVKD